MSRIYKPMPPLWHLKQMFKLSDDCPNGLIWKIKKASYEPGDPAGRLNKSTGFYMVCIDNEVYMVHRIVYYLRTGQCPDEHSVEHAVTVDNIKDNRLDLIPTYRTSVLRSRLVL